MPHLRYLILLGLLIAVPTAAAADDAERDYVRKDVADYPGNYQLIWYYTADDIPR